MNINRNNCESFFLDYYEKNLSPVEVAEVLFFLEENPDLKSTFESYEAVYLGESKEAFPAKEALKKNYSAEELDRILSSEITKHNCEQFFVAKAENILAAPQALKLEAFLSANPKLKKDFDLIQKCRLPAEATPFSHKHLLKKELVNEQNREEYFVRSLDKDLSASEQKELASFLANDPTYNKEYELFRKTILPAEHISYEFKQELKKRERKPVIVSLWIQRSAYYAAAAAILLLAGLFLFFSSNDNSATYFANANRPHVEPAKSNTTTPEKEQAAPLSGTSNESNRAGQGLEKKIPTNKTLVVPQPEAKDQKDPQPLQPVINTEETLLAKKAEDKKTNEARIDAPVVALTPEFKKDSLTSDVIAKSDTASPASFPTEAVASDVSGAKADEYETFAAVVNKKLKAMLGMEKSNECESKISDKNINLWDLAMVAKNGIQKAMGTKAVDVNKVCDGTGEKVEYVFTAGNFQISKGGPR